jgi:hypothetical protein
MANLNSVQEVISLSQNKFQWIVERKVDQLEIAMHPGSMVINDKGLCEYKNEFLVKIEEGNFHFESIEVNKSSPKVQKGSAVVWGEGLFEILNNGQTEKQLWEFTEVYFKVSGFWRIVFLGFNTH